MSKQVGKERPPDMDKALGKQFFGHFRQKPGVSAGWERAGDAGSLGLVVQSPRAITMRLENPSRG